MGEILLIAAVIFFAPMLCFFIVFGVYLADKSKNAARPPEEQIDLSGYKIAMLVMGIIVLVILCFAVFAYIVLSNAIAHM